LAIATERQKMSLYLGEDAPAQAKTLSPAEEQDKLRAQWRSALAGILESHVSGVALCYTVKGVSKLYYVLRKLGTNSRPGETTQTFLVLDENLTPQVLTTTLKLTQMGSYTTVQEAAVELEAYGFDKQKIDMLVKKVIRGETF